jgi:hypothetical protein
VRLFNNVSSGHSVINPDSLTASTFYPITSAARVAPFAPFRRCRYDAFRRTAK